MWYIYPMEYYSAITKNEVMPSVATRMNPETVIPSEVSQTEKEKDCYDILFLWNLKANDANELTYKTERDSQS